MRSVMGLLVAAVFACTPRTLVAQDACVGDSPESDALQLTPTPGGSTPVPLDSPVVARFASDVEVAQFAPEQLLSLFRLREDGTELRVAGDYVGEPAQPNVLVFQPTGGLSPRSSHSVRVMDPADGMQRTFAFETGGDVDEQPPSFAPSASLTLRAAPRTSDCQGSRVDAVFPPALDDGPRGSVEHLVFQTRGAGLEAPVLRGRVRASMDSDLSTSFVLEADEARDPVCAIVLPVDGTGRVGDALGPRCFAPDGSARFVGLCAGHPTSAGAAPAALGWAGLAFALGWRRLRRHGRR